MSLHLQDMVRVMTPTGHTVLFMATSLDVGNKFKPAEVKMSGNVQTENA